MSVVSASLDQLNALTQRLAANGVMLNVNVRISICDKGHKVKMWVQGDQMVSIGKTTRKIGNTRLCAKDGKYIEALQAISSFGVDLALHHAANQLSQQIIENFELETHAR